jgi:hypothetical protein
MTADIVEPDRNHPTYRAALEAFAFVGLPLRACHALAASGVTDLGDLRRRQWEGEGGLMRELLRHVWIGERTVASIRRLMDDVTYDGVA